MKEAFVEAGRIVNTHGVRGEVRIEVWLDSPEYLKTFPRIFLEGKEIKVRSSFVHKHFLIAKLEGIDDINDAMPLKGKPSPLRGKTPAFPTARIFCRICWAPPSGGKTERRSAR